MRKLKVESYKVEREEGTIERWNDGTIERWNDRTRGRRRGEKR